MTRGKQKCEAQKKHQKKMETEKKRKDKKKAGPPAFKGVTCDICGLKVPHEKVLASHMVAKHAKLIKKSIPHPLAGHTSDPPSHEEVKQEITAKEEEDEESKH